MPRLSLHNLVKIYGGRRVVDNVSLSVHDREIVGLLGPNGAGKTTTFYMTVGLIKPNEGMVMLDGQEITELPMYQRARKGISYLPQEPSIFRKLTVEDNVRAILQTLDLTEQEQDIKLEHLLAELGVTHLRHNRAYSLSGGERRRVEITRLLVTEPIFILLDEPFAGIDPLAVADLQNIIRQLKDRGIGVVISDHNVRETLNVCDRAYILNEGNILEEGDPAAIANSEVARRIYLGEQFKL
jgi:lipopolysaccharide export system ATP-binding protein